MVIAGDAKTREEDERTPLLRPVAEEISGSGVPPRRYALIEPLGIMLCIGWAMAGIVLSNQLIYQTCVYQGYDRDDCELLGTNSTSPEIIALETAVQPRAAEVTMACNTLIGVVPAICGLFAGPWSDRFGRRSVLIVPCVGFMITYIATAIVYYMALTVPLSPYWYVIVSLPAAFSGGMSVPSAAMYSYQTDVTPETQRVVRNGLLQASTLTGAFIGMMSSSYVLKWTDAGTVFSLGAVVMLFCIFYVTFGIEDTVRTRVSDSELSGCRKFRELFRVDMLREMFWTFGRPRPGYDRAIIWLTVVVGAVTVLGAGATNVFYLYTRMKFNWTLKDFTMWQSADFLSTIIGNTLGILVLKHLFKLPDTAIAFLSVLCYTSDNFIKGLASQGWQIYFATGISSFKGTEGPAMMAISSTLQQVGQISKIFSMALALTSTVQLAANPLFTWIYNNTLTTHPELFNFVASAIFALNFTFVGAIYVLMKKRPVNTPRDIIERSADIDQ
ncbi:proton-coupled folate transporter-like [Uranotaenia lowii]|uniref:proton-coupled folate transporter-like n=1 Tax=Uranotaenia lowii TaxID=190385 RepID=UPI00247A06B4|nr:proton-coupled folate transporter-like [Uranotaenia lowii]